MKRLIDVADLEKFIREHRCVIGFDKFLLVAGNDGKWHEALPLVKTAYDVDEVIKRLKKLRDCKYLTGITNNAYEFGACDALNDAIKIIKAGGNIELSEHSESQSD